MNVRHSNLIIKECEGSVADKVALAIMVCRSIIDKYTLSGDTEVYVNYYNLGEIKILCPVTWSDLSHIVEEAKQSLEKYFAITSDENDRSITLVGKNVNNNSTDACKAS